MLTFKEWLFESLKPAEISINPKSPIAAYQELMPQEKYRRAKKGLEFSFKALYTSNKDKIYAWWGGAAAHGEIVDQFDIDFEFSSASPEYANWKNLIADKVPYLIWMYFDAKKSHLEIFTSPEGKNDPNWEKLFMRNRMKTWVSKFKRVTRHSEYKHSEFKDFI